MDKYVEEYDSKVEQWALDQDKSDKEELEAWNLKNVQAKEAQEAKEK